MSFRAVTFNVAGGNPACTATPADILATPLIADVIHGDPDAPVVALQEVSPRLRHSLLALRGWRDTQRGRPYFEQLHVRRPGQGNALLIPQRFDVLGRLTGYLWRPMGRVVGELARDRDRANWRQALEVRMWISVVLRDTATGRGLNVFTTHLSGDARVRLRQATDLFAMVHEAGSPTLLLADLNLRPTSKRPEDDTIRSVLFPPLVDLAWNAVSVERPPVDWILGTGLVAVSARLHGDVRVSDHFPKEAVLDYAAPLVAVG
jgi:endonuclease/exonuclease/phosphatase family metal-dependent hydrolase